VQALTSRMAGFYLKLIMLLVCHDNLVDADFTFMSQLGQCCIVIIRVTKFVFTMCDTN